MAQRFVKELPVMLTDEEKIRFGSEQSRQVRLSIRLDEEKKAAAAEFKAQLEDCSNEIKRISEIISSGQEWRPVECEKHFTGGMIRISRIDTGEVIEERKPTPEEQQQTLDLL